MRGIQNILDEQVVSFLFVLLITVFLVSGLPVQLHAQSTNPLGFSIASPLQYPEQSQSLTGLRVNVFYARHRNLTGLDLGAGLSVNRLDGNLNGVQLGIYNHVSNTSRGVQLGVINVTKGDLSGLQLSLANLIRGENARATQIGITNKAHGLTGLQIGLFNTVMDLRGIQIGLLNMKQDPSGSPPRSLPARFFPLVNWTF